MSKLEELIQELCPNGVPFVKLEELCPVMRGKRLTKSQLSDDGQYVVYHGSKDTPLGFYDDYNVEGDTVIVVNTGGIGGVKYIKDNFWCSDGSFWIKHNDRINNKFLYYYLIQYEGYYLSQKRVGGVPTIDKSVVSNTRIPVPPLEVQCEIVNILDTFEKYICSLKKELVLREKSYEAIMYQLLKKEDFKNFDCLENYCYFEKGKTPIQKNIPGCYPLVATTEHLQTSDNYQFDCEAVCLPLISARGHGVASITRIYYQSGKFALGNILCAIIPTDNRIKAEFLRNYLFYYKDTLLVPLMRGGANVALTVDSLKKVQILIPSIDEQQSIIEKLRVFQEIISKENGLPTEIDRRQKQYEYYRDKLLSFKEVDRNE